jgi:hypothetical protein
MTPPRNSGATRPFMLRGAYNHGAPHMQRMLAATAIAVMVFAPQIAFAQNSSFDQTRGSMREQVKSGLEQAGFTNIEIVPEAFLVHATDPDGNPVSLMVSADAFRAMLNDHDGASSAQQEGQATSKSANPANSSSPNEADQSDTGKNDAGKSDAGKSDTGKSDAGKSAKMSAGGQNAPGQPGGMVAKLKPDATQPLTLTNAQREAMWQMLGNQPTQAMGHNPNVGQVVPSSVSLQALPDEVSDQVPAVRPYHFAMLNNQLLIVDPSSKKVVAIIAE